MAASEDTPQPAGDGVTVADPEDYVQARRLREIHDARQRVPESIREEADRIGGGINRERYNEIITDALVDYAIQLEPLLRDDEIETEEDYWSGEAVVDVGRNGGVTIEEIVEESGRIDTRGGETAPLTPTQVREATRHLNRFLYEIGLDIETDEGLPEDKLEP